MWHGIAHRGEVKGIVVTAGNINVFPTGKPEIGDQQECREGCHDSFNLVYRNGLFRYACRFVGKDSKKIANNQLNFELFKLFKFLKFRHFRNLRIKD